MTMTIGQRIKIARQHSKMTQRQLGEAIGVTPQAVTKWETDDTEPSRTNLVAIAKATSASAQWLLLGGLREQEMNGTVPAWVDGGKAVPLRSLHEVSTANYVAVPLKRVFAHFPCSDNAFAVELVDDANAPDYPSGSRWIVDPDRTATPGSLVVAVIGSDRKPVFGEYSEQRVTSGVVAIVTPRNGKWAEHRSDVGALDVVAVMTEAIVRPR